MRFSILLALSAFELALAAPAVDVDASVAEDRLEARQGLGCVYGNNQCPAKCRALFRRPCTNSYCNASGPVPYGSCNCICPGSGPVL